MASDRSDNSVVISGIGLITSLGSTREETWTRMRRGDSGLVRLSAFGWGEGGAPAPFEFEPGSEPVLTLLDRLSDEALGDAGLLDPAARPEPERIASLIGLSKGGIRSLANLASDPQSASAARLWISSWPSAGASRVACRHNLQGPSIGPVAACATGLVAVLQGAELIRNGTCDLALVGSADASLEPILLAAFRKMRALAPLIDDPARLIKPWDRRRSGFLIGEGGAVLVLERAGAARSRGVPVYAEVAGGAMGSDAFHETNLNPDPVPLAGLIRKALLRAHVSVEEIDHVNVHGTATKPNDPLECSALRLVLGDRGDLVSCSANKSQIGHLLGAAGSAELAITCLSIRDGFVPPTLNLDEPDPVCDLDGTPHVGRSRRIRAALKLSIGFGGHIAVAVLRAGDHG